MRAKMMCQSVSKSGESETVNLSAVYSADPKNPNYSWSKATPAASLSITITNPAAQGHFEQGKEYFLDFSPASDLTVPMSRNSGGTVK